ncbi:MAG: ABC transporter permease [Clostridia bacterium]|nr:ABC transporter permease [Clostridia bacterium]
MSSFLALTSRNTKVFLRDRAAVFFSFMSILIVFVLNILFIGNNIQNGIESSFTQNGFAVSDKLIKLFANGWMVAGVIGIGTITISNGSIGVLVHDNMTNAKVDFYVTPTNRVLIILSYFVSTVMVTFIMSMGMLAIVYAYLLINCMTALAFVDLLAITGIILLSTLSSTMIMTTVALFIKSENAYSVVSSLLGIIIGFASGAYMPLNIFPKAVGNVFGFVPTTGAVVLLRKHFMKTIISDMNNSIPETVTDGLVKEFGMQLKIGDWTVPGYAIILYLALAMAIALIVAAFALRRAKNK